MSVSFDEVIGAPFDGLQRVLQLPCSSDAVAVLRHAPRQHGYSESHGQAELYIIAGVVVSSDQINLPQTELWVMYSNLFIRYSME